MKLPGPTLRSAVLVLALSLVGTSAQPHPHEPEVSGDEAPYPRTPFAPATPVPEFYDWIQLTSFEWLKGRIRNMRNDELEFDSDELDILTFDWEDIREVRSPRLNIYRFDGHVILTGSAVITLDTVRIATADGLRELPRDDLQAIVQEARNEWDRWDGAVSLGMTARRGNTNSVDIATTAWTRRETARSRLRFDYSASFGTVEGVENTNVHRLNGRYDIYIKRYFYITASSLEFYRDPFSNIASRITPSAGVGYDIFRGRFEWSIEAGLAYQRTQFESVPIGESDQDDAGAVTFGTQAEYGLTQRVDLEFYYNVQVSFPKIGDTNHSTTATIEVDITEILDLDVSAVWDRIESPRETLSGEIPKSDDLRLIIGFSLEF